MAILRSPPDERLTMVEKRAMLDDLAEPEPIDFSVWRWWLTIWGVTSFLIWLMLFSIMEV